MHSLYEAFHTISGLLVCVAAAARGSRPTCPLGAHLYLVSLIVSLP